MDKLIDSKTIKSMISSIVKENAMTEEEFAECGLGCGTTTADLGAEVQYLGNKKEESDEEMEEMARGVLAPQEIAKREYATEFPDSGVKTADQFLRKVIKNPTAPGYGKYIQRFADLLRNSEQGQLSSISGDVTINAEDDDVTLCTATADAILNHRKNMSKSNYTTKGLTNAYGRSIIKRGPYRKNGLEVEPNGHIESSLGLKASETYNEVDPKDSNKTLTTFLKSPEWLGLPDNIKIKELNVIKKEADLDEIGFQIVNKEETKVLDRLIGID